MKPDRYEALMTRVVDDVATPAEREELMTWLMDHPEERAELDAHRAIKAITDGWVERLEHDLVQDNWDKKALVRWERALGIFLVVVGISVLSAWGLVELMYDPGVPMLIRGSTGGLVAGSLLLLFSVVRWRLATHPKDPYTKVIR